MTRNNHHFIVKAFDLRTKEALVLSNKFLKAGMLSEDSRTKIVEAFIKGESLLY